MTGPAQHPVIEARALTKTFRVHEKEPGLKGSLRSLVRRKWVEKRAVRELSFKVEEGEIVGLVGANGAGKTTLVKMLAGIIHPTSGDATVLGHTPWERKNDFRRRIALIMGQKAQLWWDLPAADCFLLLKEIYRIPDREFGESLARLTAALGVDRELKVQIRRLSLGERMKMELIAALLHRPKVVFLDEPTIGLDLTAQRAIRDFILEYRREHRPAMIVTSHYMEDIRRLCERILIIRDGELVYDGPLSRIMREHATHKIIRVDLKADDGGPSAGPGLAGALVPPSVGEIVARENGTLRVRVEASRVPDAAAWLLQSLQVADLAIEETDLGTVIEAIMKRGRH